MSAGSSSSSIQPIEWHDKNSKKCFFLDAKNLVISWGGEQRYWKWRRIRGTSPGGSREVFNVAELLQTCSLEVRGKFEAAKLSPGTEYKLAFVVKLRASAKGWEAPVNVKLTLPDGTMTTRTENLMDQPRQTWIEIPAGEYQTLQENTEDKEIKFLIYKYGGSRKTGLVIKGITIQPKS